MVDAVFNAEMGRTIGDIPPVSLRIATPAVQEVSSLPTGPLKSSPEVEPVLEAFSEILFELEKATSLRRLAASLRLDLTNTRSLNRVETCNQQV